MFTDLFDRIFLVIWGGRRGDFWLFLRSVLAYATVKHGRSINFSWDSFPFIPLVKDIYKTCPIDLFHYHYQCKPFCMKLLLNFCYPVHVNVFIRLLGFLWSIVFKFSGFDIGEKSWHLLKTWMHWHWLVMVDSVTEFCDLGNISCDFYC